MGMRETIEYCIDSAIKIGSQTYDKSLDFSEESVKIVDGILDGYHERYLHPEEDEGLIREHANTYAHIFGIYVGEVLLRRMDSGCGWAETEYRSGKREWGRRQFHFPNCNDDYGGEIEVTSLHWV